MNDLIFRRLKAAREKAGLTQAELSEKLGFKDRQTLAAIETGQRKISAEELLRAIKVLALDLDYFTDSFQLAGEGRFSWRTQEGAPNNFLKEFEEKAGRWIATWRRLGELQGVKPSTLQPSLALSERSSFEQAQAVAELLVEEWKLGDVPADSLESAIRKLGTLVLYVDPPQPISGAACQVPGANAILINRKEPEGRRNFDLAHELFHILTWEQMPPEHSEKAELLYQGKGKQKRIEQLANNFAAALLMPEHALQKRWQAREGQEIHRRLNDTASDFLVTATALKWRLTNLGWLAKNELAKINDAKLTFNGRPKDQQPLPGLFNAEFVKRLHIGLTKGQLSVRRAAEILDLTIEALADLFRGHKLSVPFDL
jgi:Zn-dependent peptidase ImmA (M78 family)/transcriptional regulator with XRE-family HTH domain